MIRANTFRSKSDDSFEENQKYAVVLANLVVRADRRKQGLAKILMKACEDTVISWGYNEIYLQVDSRNVAAQKLYKNLGMLRSINVNCYRNLKLSDDFV